VRKILKKNRSNLVLIALGIILILTYRIIHLFPDAEHMVYTRIIHPYHEIFASLCDFTTVSVCEAIIVLCVIAFLGVIAIQVHRYIKEKEYTVCVINVLLSLVMVVTVIYGGFCILWGPCYQAPGVGEICGVYSTGVKHEDLIAVDEFFVSMANSYSAQVNRDSEGHMLVDEEEIYGHALVLYDKISDKYPGLSATAHRPKKFFFSRALSLMNFAGFFSPLTGEANINSEEPCSFEPSCIAHELAHQRGIAAEDECNFIAVVACLEDGQTDYVYSASLLALLHLQNALYRSGDIDNWKRIRDTYSEDVITDLYDYDNYWEKYRDKVTYKASSDTYDAFLKSYDQELGNQTYGACVDLLIEYFK